MRYFRIFLACGLAFASCLSGLAEEPAAKLPEDGWWIRYFVTIKQEGNGQVQEYTNLITYSLVGTVIEEDEKNRWVEIKEITRYGPKEKSFLYKFLIPEKDLLESEQPLDKVKRAWLKANELAPSPVEKGRIRAAILPIFPGMWRNAERVDNKQTFDYQKGRLTINQAMTKTDSQTVNKYLTKRHINKVITHHHIAWFDQASSPVLTALKTRTKISDGGEVVSTEDDDMVIEDTGTDAKSELPEQN